MTQFKYGRIARLAGIEPEEVFSAIEAHHAALKASSPNVAKRDEKSVVTLHTLPSGKEICVKEFIRPALLCLVPAFIRHEPARHSWKSARRALKLGLPTPEPLAVVYGRGRHSYFLMRAAPSQEHLRAFAERRCRRGKDSKVRRHFAEAVADLFSSCWTKGVFHSDMKATNIVVAEKDGKLHVCLLDMAAVRIVKEVGLDEMILNMAQLNSSMPLIITSTDRMRVVRRVAAAFPQLAEKSVMRCVIEQSFARGGALLQ